MKNYLAGIFILASPCYIFAQTTPTAASGPVIQTVAPPEEAKQEIYDVNLNSSWRFSALTNVDKSGDAYIEVRFLPSDMLGSLNESSFMERQGKRVIKIPMATMTKRDDEGLELVASLGEDYFKTQALQMKGDQRKIGTPINAMFVNYDLNIPLQDIRNTRGNFDVNWASKYNWKARTGVLWNSETVVRLDSVWKKEFADKSSLTLGDTAGASIAGFNTLNFLGARYSTPYYNNQAYLDSLRPSIPIAGFAVNPSRLDLYLNNQLVQQSEIASGKYNLNLPLSRNGYGVAKAFVYDVTGKPVIVEVPFYGSNDIVKAGTREYDVSTGFIRRNYGLQSFDYTSPVVNGLLKEGFTDSYTQDFYVHASRFYQAASTTAHWVPDPDFGKLSLGGSVNGERQFLARAAYEKLSGKFSYGGNIELSPSFCFGYNQACVKKQTQVYLGFALPNEWGSFNMNYTMRDSSNGKAAVATVQYTKQLFKNINMFANFTNVRGSDASQSNKTLYVGLSYALGGPINASTSVTSDKGGLGMQQGIYVSENTEKPYLGSGSATFQKTPSGQTENFYYGARLKNFSYQTNFYKDERGSSLSTNLSGGVVYVPEENYVGFSKQVTSGLAFVKVDNARDPIAIYHENKLSGYTDSKGRMVVPDTIAQNTETVNVDVNRLPAGVTIDDYKKIYYVPYSGAVRVDFKAKPLPYVVKINGVKAGTIFNIGDDYFVVGENGQTSMDNVGNASLPLEGGKTCDIEFKTEVREYTCK